MTLLILTLVFGILLFGIGLFLALHFYKKSQGTLVNDGKKMKGGKGNRKWFFLTAIWVPILLIPLCNSFVSIKANEVGIVYDELNGGVQTYSIGEGIHSKSIFQNVTPISTANRSAKISTYGQTSDGQSAQFALSIIYAIKAEDAGNFYKKTSSTTIADDQLNAIVKQSLQTSTIEYNIFDLLSEKLESARVSMEDYLKTSLYKEYYISLVKISIDDVDAGAEVEAILKQKAEADQKIEIAKKEAEAALITANNEAAIKKTLAEAEAYATEVNGKAKAGASSSYTAAIEDMVNKLYVNINGIDASKITLDPTTGYIISFPKAATETLTYAQCADTILSIVFYNSWNGVLPTTLTSDELSSLIGTLIASGKTGTGTGSGTTGTGTTGTGTGA